MLTNKVKNEIRLHAHSVSPNECCGYIIKRDGDYFIFTCKNISPQPDIFFEIDPKQYLEANGKGEIVGIYHSQEESRPSDLDCMNTKSHFHDSIVYSWKHNTFCVADYTLSPYMKYVGRNFQIYHSDCLTLVRDFYKQEYNIHISNYFRDEKWFKKDPLVIKNNYAKEGFSCVDDMGIGDVIIFKLAHLGIYLGKNTFLHHPHDRISTIEQLTDKWNKHIDLVVRHESKQ